jgi:ribosome-binding protein aMBF1 (putative translation factor)
MNTLSEHKLKELQNKFKSLKDKKSEDDLIKEDEFVLMANYLSEIEKFQRDKGLNRKDLAHKIKKSASYLTQVFRGDKPLNFNTLAHIQKALGIRFKVTAFPKSEFPKNSNIHAQTANYNVFIIPPPYHYKYSSLSEETVNIKTVNAGYEEEINN